MAKTMWYGTVDGVGAKLQYVPLPKTGMMANRQSWSETVVFENGGANVSRSRGSHRVYEMEFPMQENIDLDIFADYAAGIYGNGRMYFADPMIFDQNILPVQWAAPMTCGVGGWPEIGNKTASANTTANIYGHPATTNTYKIGQISNAIPTNGAQYVTLVIPPTHALWWGWNGTVSGTGTMTMAAHRISDGVIVYFNQAPTAVTTSTLLGGTPISGATYDWVKLFPNRTATGGDIVTGRSATYSGTSITNGRTVPSFAIANPSRTIFVGGAEFPAGVASTTVTNPVTTATYSSATSVVTGGTGVAATGINVYHKQEALTATAAASITWGAGVTDTVAQSIALRGTPSLNGIFTSAFSQVNTGQLTIAAPATVATNDVLVAVLRSSSSSALSGWTSDGWDLQSQAFIPGSGTKAQAILTRIVTAASAEPLAYTFKLGGRGRAVGTILQFNSVNLDYSFVSPSSMMAQLWPIGTTPILTGSFIKGKGNSGCRFDEDMMPMTYFLRDNTGRDVHLTGLSATLRETGAWEDA